MFCPCSTYLRAEQNNTQNEHNRTEKKALFSVLELLCSRTVLFYSEPCLIVPEKEVNQDEKYKFLRIR